MIRLTSGRHIALLMVAAVCFVPLSTVAADTHNENRRADPDTRFALRPPDAAAVSQLDQLLGNRQLRNAFILYNMLVQPQAVWLNGGTPTEVAEHVEKTLREAALERARAVFALYNIPGRDCGGYSAGGAETTPAYQTWIDAITGAIRERRAIVILEPDALANLPSDCGYDPTGQLTTDRYTQLAYAIKALESLPGTQVYLDAGHSHWQSVGTIASRLVQAGLAHTQGFFLNVSNYQPTAALIQYGTWIGECIAFANDPSQGGWRLGHYDFCGSQYFPANADDYSTWALTDAWYAQNLSLRRKTRRILSSTRAATARRMPLTPLRTRPTQRNRPAA